MKTKWLRRAASVTRKRLRMHLRIDVAPPMTGTEKREKLIEMGRRGRAAQVSASVVELPARASLHKEAFVQPTILVLQMAHIGDFILSLRSLERLREGFPDSEITLVCGSWNVDWARQTGLVDKVVAFDFFSRLNEDWRGPTSNVFERFAALPLGDFDIAVDLRHDADTRPCLYRVAARARAGYAAPVESGYPSLDLMLPQVELLPMSDGREYSLHAELRFGLLADAVVAAFAELGPHPVLRLARGARPEASRPYAILAVGAGDPIRRWPQASFIELGRELIELFDLNIVVVGGKVERSVVEAIVSSLPAERVTGYVDLSLPDLTAKVGQAALLVGLGSGVAHLASNLGVPTISLLSGVSPLDVWRPIGPRVVNLTGHTPCSPCILRRAEECPFGVVCFTSVTPEHVLVAVGDLLRARPARGPAPFERSLATQGEPSR